MIFKRKTKTNVLNVNEPKCIYVDGQMWTDMSFMSALNPHGVIIHVAGDVMLQTSKSNMLNSPGHFWVPASLFPEGVADIIAYSRIFKNNRYKFKDKKYDRGNKDLCIFQNSVS